MRTRSPGRTSTVSCKPASTSRAPTTALSVDSLTVDHRKLQIVHIHGGRHHTGADEFPEFGIAQDYDFVIGHGGAFELAAVDGEAAHHFHRQLKGPYRRIQGYRRRFQIVVQHLG